MFPFNRKQPKETWNQAKSEYEDAIRRCYAGKWVTLALCGFNRFTALNFKRYYEEERKPFVETDFQFWGVVDEERRFSKHVRCELENRPEPSSDDVFSFDDLARSPLLVNPLLGDRDDLPRPGRDFIGELSLTHLNAPGDQTPREAQRLLLHVALYDPTSMFRTSLTDGLRDAALSGFRFVHVRLECREATNDEFEKVLSDMRAMGFASTRYIRTAEMSPQVELPNAPEWAKREEG
jgi:hypothetical protein